MTGLAKLRRRNSNGDRQTGRKTNFISRSTRRHIGWKKNTCGESHCNTIHAEATGKPQSITCGYTS